MEPLIDSPHVWEVEVPTIERVLNETRSVLLIDWPSRDVPDTLARAGYAVTVSGGPEPDNFSVYEVVGDELVVRHVGRPPEHAQLVYAHRPMEELPDVIAAARRVGATTVWTQSGLSDPGHKDATGCWRSEDESDQARLQVEAAGLTYIDDVYLPDAVRRLRTTDVP
jgi:predicted CoA-binding protein